MDNNNNICKCRRCDGVIHEIVAGDTLYTLSRRYNVSVGSILKANRGINPYNLMIGEQLCIPMNIFVDLDMNNNASNIRNNMNGSNMNGEMSTNRNNMNNANDMGNMGRNTNNNMNNTRNMNNSDMNLRNNMNGNMRNPWDMEDTEEYEIEFTGIKDDEEMSREMLLDEIISRKDMTLGKFAEIIKNM